MTEKEGAPRIVIADSLSDGIKFIKSGLSDVNKRILEIEEELDRGDNIELEKELVILYQQRDAVKLAQEADHATIDKARFNPTSNSLVRYNSKFIRSGVVVSMI